MSDEFWESELPSDPPFWRLLHLLGDYVGSEFNEVCKQNASIIDLLGPEAKYPINFTSSNNSLTTEWICAVDDMIIDLTKITDTNNTLRWQTSYHTNCHKQIIFDSGASISISPHRNDFISLDTSSETIHNLSNLSSK